MTIASEELQKAIVTAIEAHPALNGLITGVYDNPAPRLVFPYISIGDGPVGDWSTKTVVGREIISMLTVWDDGEAPARLQAIMSAVEEAMAALPRDLPGWRIASLVFLRERIVRDAAGPWAGLIDHRIRMMAV
jgi:hypothetical protein